MASRSTFLAFLLVAAALFAAAADARAQGFFDYLFGGPRPPSYGAGFYDVYPRTLSPTRRVRSGKAARRAARPSAPVAEASSRSEGFCVRRCDGYYFPLVTAGHDSPQDACDAGCPGARVDVYEGASIETARGPDGDKYTALPNAFRFRDQRQRACSCNPPEGSQAYFQRMLRKDPTLRAGDIIFEKKGAFVFDGWGFSPAERSSLLTAATRAKIRAVVAAARMAPPRLFTKQPATYAVLQRVPPAARPAPAEPIVATDMGEPVRLGPALVSLRGAKPARPEPPASSAPAWIFGLLAMVGGGLATHSALRRRRAAAWRRAARLAKISR